MPITMNLLRAAQLRLRGDVERVMRQATEVREPRERRARIWEAYKLALGAGWKPAIRALRAVPNDAWSLDFMLKALQKCVMAPFDRHAPDYHQAIEEIVSLIMQRRVVGATWERQVLQLCALLMSMPASRSNMVLAVREHLLHEHTNALAAVFAQFPGEVARDAGLREMLTRVQDLNAQRTRVNVFPLYVQPQAHHRNVALVREGTHRLAKNARVYDDTHMAEEWTNIPDLDQAHTYMYNVRSLDNKGEVSTAWHKSVYTSPGWRQSPHQKEWVDTNVRWLQPVQKQQSQGGTAQRKHKHTNGRSYTVRTGPRGGRYIMVNGHKTRLLPKDMR